jgi:hypothetical protein
LCLKCDFLLSKFDFKCNLYHYSESTDEASSWSYPVPTSLPSNGAPVVGPLYKPNAVDP